MHIGTNMTHTVRRVFPTEYYKYREHLKSLDADSRSLRFGFGITNESIDKLCDTIEHNTNKHILFCIEDADLKFIAVGHIALSDNASSMELAFSVLKECQGNGMGDLLMKRCIRYCRTHNIYRGHMVCLSRNAAIRKLCSKNRLTVVTDGTDAETAIELPLPSIKTFFKELLAINLSLLNYIGKRYAYTIKQIAYM